MKTPQPTNDEKQQIRIAQACGWKYDKSCAAPWNWWTPDNKLTRVDALPKYKISLTAIQSAVAAQSVEFRSEFNALMVEKAIRRKCFYSDLTAPDWCDAFCAVLDSMGKGRGE